MSRTGPPPGLWSNGSSPSNQSSNNSSTNSTSSLLTIVKAQIVFLLSTLTDENWSKNRDEIRSLIELHGPEPQLHFIRRLVTASFSSPSSAVPSPLVIKLLCTEVVRMSRDTILAERFKEAINPTLDSTSTETLSTFSLEALLALPGLIELSALEKLVFCSPFLNLLNSVENSGTNLGKAAASTIHSVLSAALEQLSAPPSSPSDLPELSPLSISKLFSILLSDLYIDETQVFSDEERRSIIMGAVRGRLGAEVGSQALTHAFSEMTFSTTSPPSVISILTRLSPALALCSLDLVRAILLRFGGLTSGSEGEGGNELRVTTMLFALVDLATVDAELAGSIDLANFVKGIYELVPGLKWGEVVRGYDNPLRGLPDSWGLRLFAAFLPLSPSSNGSGVGLMCGEGGNSAIEGLWGKWTNPTIQFNLLERLIYLPLDSFNLSTLSSITKVVSLEDSMRSSPTVKGLVQGVVGSQWNCKELIGVLVGLGSENATTELGGRVRELLERAIKAAPELVLIALIQLDKPWSTLHLSLIARLLSTFLTGHPSHQLVFLKIYQSDSSFLLAALQDFYAESEINITRILDIAQDLKILEQVLELRPFFLALDLAALASRREYLNLEKWLSTGIEKLGGVFVRATLEFVGHKVRHDLTRQGGEEGEGAEVSTVGLSAGTVALFMRALRLHHELFTGNDVELFKEVRTQCLQLYPRLMNFSPGNIDSEAGMSVVNFTAEIEAEVDASYQKMYDAEISVENVVAGLQRAKQSDNQHDHEFLACFLHGLFEEHRFFNTYPPIQLTLTANLFGDLIQFQLIDFIPLGIAVRYVLDALRNPPDSTWFSFGIQALGRFSSRLEEWPQLAHSILAIDHLELSNPEVIQFARAALLARERGEGLDLGGEDREGIILDQVGLEPLEEMERPSFTAIAVVLDGEALVEPAEEIMDKILFIINNLAPSNFDEKVLEMADKMEISHFNWFAHYIVAQRVSIEPNNHGLYLKFLDSLAKPLLIKRVLYETFIKLETLLNSEKTVQSSTERTLLKNLGSWLGSLTLAKNKPIKQTNIAFKELLIQGYDSNRLIVAIPFVCKVLEQCSKSKVFKPPNPWLMAILRLLVELYQFAELKLNLKFEIEVLCKSLNVDLKEMEASDILRNRVKEIEKVDLKEVLAMDLEERALQRNFAPINGGAGGLEAQRGAAGANGQNVGGYSLSLQDTISAALQSLPSQITFNSQIPLFTSNSSLKRLVFVAIDRAIREIIAPVVERSVTIAGISTRELTMKDFAMEGDEEKMSSAAHLMVSNLAGSLALVTCKEPLRISMVTQIRNLFLQNGFGEGNLPEQAILVVVNDNLDLACGVVEKVAMEKAVLEVDDGLAPAYLARRTHRERSREAFWDTAAMAASHYSGMLPDPLRLKLGGLLPLQLQVYEDFSRSRTLQIQAELRNGLGYGDSPALVAAEAPRTPQLLAVATPVPELSAAQAMEKFSSLISELEKLLATESTTSLSRIGSEHDIKLILQQIPLLATESSSREEIALAYSQKVVQLLYRSETTLAREVYVVLLEKLCNLSQKVTKEVTAWLIFAEDERKFNVPVTIALIQAKIISVAELDGQLAKFIVREFRNSVVDFAARLVGECLLIEPILVTRAELSGCLEALGQAGRVGKGTETSRQLLQELRAVVVAPVESPIASAKPTIDDAGVREQLTYCFGEWVRLYQHSFSVEKSFVDFVVQLQNQGILKGEEISSLFFRVCAEVSVDSYIKHKAAGGTPSTGIFQPVDAFAKLIVFMIKYHADPTGVNNDKAKVHYMTKVLSIVVLVLAQSHEELGPHFQQKPFFRFFSSLLSNLHAIESHLGSAYYQILVALSHSVNTLQPMFFPGFTFSWVGLISHRLFMPKLLMMKDKEGWSSFHRQLISLLRFLAPFLRKGELGETTRALYLGTQRIILVLLHDFPDFLSQGFFGLCDAIPPQCIQLHNLILSAFPVTSSLRLPDPLQPGLKIELLTEITKSPIILTDYTISLSTAELRAPLDTFLQTRSPATLPETLKQKLLSTGGQDSKYNIPLINSLVMYLGVVALNQSKAQTGTGTFVAKSTSTLLLQSLIADIDPEGRYFIIAAAANQLRYPNAHTYWFSSFLLSTFGETSDELVREQIVRVLLERIIVSRPHAWGILFTFSQLLSNPAYRLLEHSFVTRTPEVSSLFNQVQARATVTA